MTKTDTRDVRRTLLQIRRLIRAGCELVRIAVPDREAALALARIRSRVDIPIAADIHFNAELALMAVDAGVDKLRINPGNISEKKKVALIARRAAEAGIPIRIGVNAGSLGKAVRKKFGGATPAAMVESALSHIRILESHGFRDVVVSLKASDIDRTIRAYRLLSRRVDYPLHLGITEAGGVMDGTVKSAIGIGLLLHEGLGNTLRVSLTGDPVEEVRVGFRILKALGLRDLGPEIISCPTCGRCRTDLLPLLREVEKGVSAIGKKLTIAVMGCEVNGPGEAREADIGIAGTAEGAVIFKRGKILKKIRGKRPGPLFLKEVRKMAEEEAP
jgi:(E)-4-hydroxy-3-methylbut-2-enyl-diphosphate synthase